MKKLNSSLKAKLLIIIFPGLIACQNENKNVDIQVKKNLDNLDFICIQENDHFPRLDPQADIWFKQARAMEKAVGAKDNEAITALYRQAAEKDHYKAMANLQDMLRTGEALPLPGKTRQDEAVDLVERLIQLKISYGFYIMGTYLEKGYGVEQDRTASLVYYRKAADLGNPEGQYVVGDLFLTKRLLPQKTINPAYAPEIGRRMLLCSLNQGYSKAGDALGVNYQIVLKNYTKALESFQLATKFGSVHSALNLEIAFKKTYPTDSPNYLGVAGDPERFLRYHLIRKEIMENPAAKFPDIDKIVPLPPTPLPEWDGTFEYKKQHTE